MAGHSKWANIRHKKSKEDAKRGKIFTKLIKEITVAARTGGGEPDNNPRLRDLIDKAKDVNMPQDNIVRAIKKGTGELPGVNYEPHTYEGYGPHGIAVIVEALTDNKNRTVASLRHVFTSKGGNLAETGSVNWMFEQMGVIRITPNGKTEDDILELLLDHDVNDISAGDSFIEITCSVKSLAQVKQALVDAGIHVEEANIEWIGKTPMSLEESEENKALEFLSALEDIEDVQNVYTNLE